MVHEPSITWPAPPALPIGELHPDFFIPSEKMTIEVKSSEHVDGLFDSALLQAKGQVHFSPEAESGALVFLDRDYQETDWFPVVVTEEDAEEIEAIAAAVVHAGKTGELPPRVCERPTDGIQHMCPFIESCFEGWQPPEQEEHVDASAVVSEAYLAKRDLDAKKAELKPFEERWELARASLEEVQLPPGVDVLAGSVLVKRTLVSESERFSLSKAVKLGLVGAAFRETFDSCISRVSSHSRWSFKRVGDEPLDVDYGDTPPF